MSTVAEIQDAIEKLSSKEKKAISTWIQSQDEPVMKADEEAALLASLDRAARELHAGNGVPIEDVRKRIAKWAGK